MNYVANYALLRCKIFGGGGVKKWTDIMSYDRGDATHGDVRTWQQLRQPDPKNKLLAAFLSLHLEAAGWTRGDQSPRISTIQYLVRQQTNPVTLAASRNHYTVTCFLSNLI